MSLKAFHIVFIVCSTLLAFGFGVWGVYMHFVHDSILLLGMGVCSLVAGVGLVLYGLSMGKKLRQSTFR